MKGCVQWYPINPIALRKTKIADNFGLSECYRVNSRKDFDFQWELSLSLLEQQYKS